MPGSVEYKWEWERQRLQDPEYRARRNAYQSAWKKSNREKLREGDRIRAAEWRAANPERERAKTQRYARSHPEVKRAAWMRREAAKQQRLPVWADLGKTKKVYEEARRLTEATGVPHEVDHVLPLRGRLVSGLHVHNNLKVVTRRVNRTKSDKYVP